MASQARPPVVTPSVSQLQGKGSQDDSDPQAAECTPALEVSCGVACGRRMGGPRPRSTRQSPPKDFPCSPKMRSLCMAPQTPHTGAHRHVPGFQPQTCSLNISWPSRPQFQGAFCRHQQAAGLDLCGLGIHRSDHPPVTPRNP